MKDEGPLEYKMEQKYLLYGKEIRNVMRLTFPTHKACTTLEWRCKNKKGLVIDDLGRFQAGEFIVHEKMIDPIVKFTATANINLSSWIEVTETVQEEDQGLDEEERKFTTADLDIHCSWEDVKAAPTPPGEEGIVHFKYVSFDIECYSANHNSKIPDPEAPGNFVLQIGNTTGRFGDPETKRVIFTLFNPHPIKGVKIVRCADEKEVILRWKDYINEQNPDV